MGAAEELFITEEAADTMRAAAAASHPNQTGGILVGVFADGQPWVIAAVEVPGDGSPTTYTLPEGAGPVAVEDARQRIDPRVGYLGEWHSHTDDTGPSAQDQATMRALARQSLPDPIPYLLLVRRRAATYVVEAYHETFTAPISMVATGPLPTDDLEEAIRVAGSPPSPLEAEPLAGDDTAYLIGVVRDAIAELDAAHQRIRISGAVPYSNVRGGCMTCSPQESGWPCVSRMVADDLRAALARLGQEGSDG